MSQQELLQRLEAARVKQNVFNEHILPFIKHREVVLFHAFCSLDAGDTTQMQKIKMQMSVLRALEAEFIGHIDDGKVAQAELNTLE